MTKKDYIALAQAISPFLDSRYGPEAARLTAEAIALNIANYAAKDNPRFNRERFLEACGYEEE